MMWNSFLRTLLSSSLKTWWRVGTAPSLSTITSLTTSMERAMDWNLPNSYGEALNPSVTAFGDGTFKEEIKVQWGHKGEAINHYDQYPNWRGRNTRDGPNRGTPMWRHSEKEVICWPQDKPTPPPPSSWTSSFWNTEEIKSYCLSHNVCDVLLWQPRHTNTEPVPECGLNNCSMATHDY